MVSRQTKRGYAIIVTGLPGSGKTTLARRLGSELSLPVYEKDRVKEILFDDLGWKDLEWSHRLSQATFDILLAIADTSLAAGAGLILEANFRDDPFGPRLSALGKQHGARFIQVLCGADGTTLARRFRERGMSGARHPGHGDPELASELDPLLLTGWAEPLAIDGPLFRVDTTDFNAIDYQGLLRLIRDFQGKE